MVELLSLTQSELPELLAPPDQSAFRARQVGEWLSRGRKIPEMTNLPAKLREQMSEIAVANPVSVREVRRSEVDDTEKFLYALPDGNIIEGVLMRYHHGDTLCLSTQVGCRMGCRFCASTIGGCARNLSHGEMLGQVACANRHI